MSAKIFQDHEVSLAPLQDGVIAVIGYGSQGRSHALNLDDSGLDVVVGLRAGSPSEDRCRRDGLRSRAVEEACHAADLVAILVPDQEQPMLYRDTIEPNLRPGAALLFAHGFNIRFEQIIPPATGDVVMVGPKAPGPVLRSTFEEGGGVPALVAVDRDITGNALQVALAYAKGIGCTRVGALLTSFAEETETDLFGEQAVLAGGTGRLVQLGFQTLVEAGYQPEVAYFECLHELKLVVDIMQQRGIAGMGRAISDTAEYGSLTRGPRVLDGHARAAMKQILEDIRSGEFAREWMMESRTGSKVLEQEREKAASHPMEPVGTFLRSLMEQR